MLREERNFYETLIDPDIWLLKVPMLHVPIPLAVPRDQIIKAITINYYRDLISENKKFDKNELVKRIKYARDMSNAIKSELINEIAFLQSKIKKLEDENYKLANSKKTIQESKSKPIETENNNIIQINGEWKSNFFVQDENGNRVMVTYEITQEKDTFSWTVDGPGIMETTKDGKINGRKISIKYNRTKGPHQTGGQYLEVKGTVITDSGSNKAKRIDWSNKAVWNK